MNGNDDFDLIFGESEGSAYEHYVESHGDDVGYGAAAFRQQVFGPSSAAAQALTAPPGAPPAAPSTPSPMSLRLASFDRQQLNLPSSFATTTTPTTPTHHRRHRRHHHHHDQNQQTQAPAPAVSPFAAPTAPVSTWPPPRPVNLLPGAPWPPPGAAPGSDLSSFYPPGSAAANPAFWGAQQPAPPPGYEYAPIPGYSTYAMPSPTVDVYAGGIGVTYDNLGRASIVDLPKGNRRGKVGAFVGAFVGHSGKGDDVNALRGKLRTIGLQVPARGPVDQRLTDAVNSVFRGWDDAPEGLRAGDMTTTGLSGHMKLVNRLVGKAIGGAQHLEHAERG